MRAYTPRNEGICVDKLHILQVNKLYAPWVGGVERVVQDVAEGLRTRTDMQVLVCQPKGKGRTDVVGGVPVTRASSLGTFFSMPVSFSFFRLLRKMSRGKQIVQFHMPFPLADLAYFFSGYKGKVVLWWHADIVRQKKLMWVYKPIMQRFLKRADCIVVATQGHIDSSAYLGPYRDKCRIIPYGLDIPAYQAQVAAHSPLAQAQGKRILFIGRLVYYKGVSVLLRAFANVRGAELFLVGDGPLREELQAFTQEAGMSERVHFLGKLPDEEVKACLRDCDFLAFPSVANSEGFGLVQLEAMSFGKPVINTSLPTGVPYVSLDEVTGLTVPPEDEHALAQAMQRMVDDDSMRAQMGARAKARGETEFNLQTTLQRLLDLYDALAASEGEQHAAQT